VHSIVSGVWHVLRRVPAAFCAVLDKASTFAVAVDVEVLQYQQFRLGVIQLDITLVCNYVLALALM